MISFQNTTVYLLNTEYINIVFACETNLKTRIVVFSLTVLNYVMGIEYRRFSETLWIFIWTSCDSYFNFHTIW